MNVHPFERAAARPAPAARTAHAVATAETRETLVQQCAAMARQLGELLLAQVQNATSLNLSAAKALLAQARIPTPANLQQRSDTWRHSWRSFEVCATSADQLLNLTRGHVERTTTALWRTTDRLLGEMQELDGARVATLRAAFDAMRAAQSTYWEATQAAHHELIALAQSPLPAQAAPESGHGAH